MCADTIVDVASLAEEAGRRKEEKEKWGCS